jgi:hypothetical protein
MLFADYQQIYFLSFPWCGCHRWGALTIILAWLLGESLCHQMCLPMLGLASSAKSTLAQEHSRAPWSWAVLQISYKLNKRSGACAPKFRLVLERSRVLTSAPDRLECLEPLPPIRSAPDPGWILPTSRIYPYLRSLIITLLGSMMLLLRRYTWCSSDFGIRKYSSLSISLKIWRTGK